MRTEKLVKTSTLQVLTPLTQLPLSVLDRLSTMTYFETEAAGNVLCARGCNDPWSFYLLSGEVTLIQDGGQRTLLAGSAEAKIPVNFVKPTQIDVVAKSNIVFIRIQDDLLKKAWGDQVPRVESASVVETEDNLIKKVMADIQRDYKANKLIIPSLPDMVIKIREAVDNPKTESEDVTRLIQMDPALTARLVQVANSPIYRGGQAINSCRMAVSRLGLKNTRDLVVSCTLQQLFKSDSAVLNEIMVELWQRATLTAAISSIIAKYVRGVDEDRALLAGLISEIGVLPIIAYMEKYPKLSSSLETVQQIIGDYGVAIGVMVLRRWDFDKEMIAVISEAGNWFRDTQPEVDYCDVVMLAKYYAASEAKQAELPELSSLPVFNKISQGRLGENLGARVLDIAQNEIEEIQNILLG